MKLSSRTKNRIVEENKKRKRSVIAGVVSWASGSKKEGKGRK